MPILAIHHMYINHRYRADINKSKITEQYEIKILIHAIVTEFNKTLDVNLEHTGLGYTRNQSINHQHFFRKDENTKASLFSADMGRCCYAFCALVRTFSDHLSISGPFAFNDVEAEIALTSRS